MKRIVLFIALVILSFGLKAQTQPSVLPSPRSDSGFAQYNWIRALNGGIIFPTRDTLFTPTYIGSVVFWRNPLADTALWVFAQTTGRRWYRVVTLNSSVATGTVTSVGTNNGTGITGGTITVSGTLAIDTSIIATRLRVQKGIDSIGFIKLNISDTSAMLLPYLRKSDTSFMLLPYLKKSDTAQMLNGYVRGIPTSINNGVLKWDGTTGNRSKKSNLIIEDYFDIDASLVELYGGVDSFGNGREVALIGSNGTTGSGGAAFLVAGIPASGNGSNAGVYASDAANGGNGNGGSILLDIGGKRGSGTNGSIRIDMLPDSSGFGTLKRGHIRLDSLTTSPNGTINARTWQMPNASGTFALRGDTTYLGNFVRLQTANLFRQDGKIWVSDTIRTSGVVRADSHVRTDSINSGLLRLSGDIRLQNNEGIIFRRSDASTSTFITLSPLDTFNVGVIDVPTVIGGNGIRFNLFNTLSQSLQNKSGTIALTTDITDSSSALRSAINTKLNISDTATMLAGLSFDRVLANGNLTGRGFTAGASNFNGLLRGYEKSFFTTSATGATDTVVSVRSAAAAPAFVVQNSNGQAINAQATNATGILSTVTGSSGSALDLVASSGGRLINAVGNGSTAMLLSNGGRLQVRDSIVLATNNRSVWGQGNIGGVFQLIGTNTSNQIVIGNGGNQINLGGALSGTSASFTANGNVGLFSDGVNYTVAIARSGVTGNVGLVTGTVGSSLGLGANNVEQARLTTTGLLVKTTTDNGTDALQVAGSGLFTGGIQSNSNISANGGILRARNAGYIEIYESGNGNWIDMKSTSGNFALRTDVGGTPVNAFTLAPTGAATFSSSVTAGGNGTFGSGVGGSTITDFTVNGGSSGYPNIRLTTGGTLQSQIQSFGGVMYLQTNGSTTALTLASNQAATFSSSVTAKHYTNNTTSVSTTYSVANDIGVVFADATSGNFTITLPTASSWTGRVVYIKRTDCTLANSITISGATDNGSLGVRDGAIYISNGSTWYCIAIFDGSTSCA